MGFGNETLYIFFIFHIRATRPAHSYHSRLKRPKNIRRTVMFKLNFENVQVHEEFI